MIVYLSGPMTGIDNLNRDGFEKAEEDVRATLKNAGDPYIRIINPWKLSAEIEKKYRDVLGRECKYSDYLKEDLKELLNAHAVFLLPGWNKSRGCRIEINTADAVDIPCFFELDELREHAEKNIG